MRVALFGGSFDPPHRGHVALARLARQRLAIDRILVAPVATQPFKQETLPASFNDRVAMARLAFASEPGTEISLLDSPRPDGSSNYTVDTIEELRRHLVWGDTLFCIVGADSFLTIRNWHRSADLLTACDLIVGARPDFSLDPDRVQDALPQAISAKPIASAYPHTHVFELKENKDTQANSPDRRTKLYLLTDLNENVSATQIRSALGGESNATPVLDPAVMDYIHSLHLYTYL
jgi:nicotinate-nucleotide adenylyltransferase